MGNHPPCHTITIASESINHCQHLNHQHSQPINEIDSELEAFALDDLVKSAGYVDEDGAVNKWQTHASVAPDSYIPMPNLFDIPIPDHLIDNGPIPDLFADTQMDSDSEECGSTSPPASRYINATWSILTFLFLLLVFPFTFGWSFMQAILKPMSPITFMSGGVRRRFRAI